MKRKILSIGAAALLMMNSTISYAQVFTDIPDGHWAKEYVEKMNNAKIITGYNDATFKPNEEVTKVQSLVMMSRMFGLDKEKVKDIRAKHQTFLTEIGVETWYQDGIAIAIESGIVDKDVVEDLYKNKEATKPATKEEISIYLTRVMGLEKQANDKTFYVLSFTDSETITPSAKPYVDMMVEKEIINKKGDDNGKLNPKASINRAVMSKMLSVAYDYMQDNDVKLEVEEEKTIEISGKISKTMKLTDEIFITVEDKKGNKNAYTVNSDSIIKLDDKDAKIADLVEGLTITAKVTENRKVIEINAESINEKYSGKIYSIILTNTDQMLTIQYKEDEKTEKKAFYVDSDVKVNIDGEEAFLYNIKEGDTAEIRVENSRIVEIIAESRYKSVSGIIKEIKYTPEPVIVVEDENGTTYEYSLGNKMNIKRNKKEAEISDIRKGDEVEIDVEYDFITDIDAKVVKKSDNGTIKSILISNEPQITIINEDGEDVIYAIANGVSIDLDTKDSDIYGLRLGYYVELEIEGNEVIDIEADERELNNRYEGEIIYVHEDAHIIVLNVRNVTTKKVEPITISVSEKTLFYDEDGTKGRFSHLDKGDKILVIGENKGGIVDAKSIIMMQDVN